MESIGQVEVAGKDCKKGNFLSYKRKQLHSEGGCSQDRLPREVVKSVLGDSQDTPRQGPEHLVKGGSALMEELHR